MDQVFVLAMATYNLARMRTLGQARLQGAHGGKTDARAASEMRKNARLASPIPGYEKLESTPAVAGPDTWNLGSISSAC